MKRAYKTELNPTPEQAQKMRRGIGICRFLYNLYITENKKLYRMYQRGLLDSTQPHFLTAIDFDKYVNNKLKLKPQYAFISKCGSKARKRALVNAESAIKLFWKGRANFPRFKKKQDQEVKLYFPRNNKTDWTVQRHRIKIPTFGYVKLKEYGYLPIDAKVINGFISYSGGRYFASITVEANMAPCQKADSGIGIKLVQSNKLPERTKQLEQKLAKQQRKLRRKYRLDKAMSAGKEKQLCKVQRLEQKLAYSQDDHINKLVAQAVSSKPKYITIEYSTRDTRLIADFKAKLAFKCASLGIELRRTDDLQRLAVPVLTIKT